MERGGSLSSSSRTLNPVEIPCILQQILICLPFNDLQRIRLVSSTFNIESTRLLRKRSKIVLNSPKKLLAFNLEELWKSIEEKKFCESFQLINVPLSTPVLMMFLKKFGHTVKSFELKDSNWSAEDLESILLETLVNLDELTIHGAIPKDCPRILQRGLQQVVSVSKSTASEVQNQNQKLSKIKYLDLHVHDKERDDDLLIRFVTDLLSSVCNLEVLQCKDSSGKLRSRREHFQRILFELLINPELKLSFPKLGRINFPLSPWDDIQLQRLNGKQFPLRHLNLIILPNISTKALKYLLISLKNTLVKLKLSFSSWRMMELPCNMNLEKLQHLHLDWFNGSLKFVSHIKNLRTLILAQVDLNEIFTEDEIKQFVHPCSNLTRLEIYQHTGPVLPNTVEYMSQVFPKISTLVIGKLNDESLRVVIEKFPRLEVFSAIEGIFTDDGLTGISITKCKSCNDKHLSRLCKGLYDESLVNAQRKHGFIGDLQYLQKLEIKSPYLTNLSVIHGIVFCTRLKSLSLWCYELNFRSLKKLVDTLTLQYLETTHSFSHIAEIRYALARMLGRKFILNGIVAPTGNSLISPEARNFIAQFHDNVCRNIISNMKHNHTPHLEQSDRHKSTTWQNQHHLLLIYEACMAEQQALHGLINL